MRRAGWRTRTAAVAAAGMVAGVALAGCDFDGAYDLPLPGHPVDADEAFEVTAYFEDVLNVVPRSPVMVDDVVVGEVTEVERVGWNAKVTMLVREDVKLPDNTIADIRQVSLLGEKYVALAEPAQPSAGRLSDGDEIALAATGRNPEVEDVLGALSMLLSGGGVAQLSTITREANLVMSGREDRLRGLLSSLDSVVGTLNQQRGDIINALESLDSLTATLNAEKDTIGAALDATGPAIEVLAAQHDELIAMLGALERLGKVGTRVINASKEDVLSILGDLGPILRRLSEADEQLAPGLNLLVSFPFPQSANAIVEGDYADTVARFDFNFRNFYKTLGLPDLDLASILGLAAKSPVAACRKSKKLSSSSCTKVVTDPKLLDQLQTGCERPKQKASLLCQTLAAIPDSELQDLIESIIPAPTDPLGGLLNGLLGRQTSSRQSSVPVLL